MAVLGGYVTRAPRGSRSSGRRAAGWPACPWRFAGRRPWCGGVAPRAVVRARVGRTTDRSRRTCRGPFRRSTRCRKSIMASVVGWFLLGLVDGLTAGWTRRKALGAAFFIAARIRGGGAGRHRVARMVGRLGRAHRRIRPRGLRLRLPGGAGSAARRVAATHTLGAIKAAWSGAYPGVALSQGLRVGDAVRRGVAAAVPVEAARRPAGSGAADANGAGLSEAIRPRRTAWWSSSAPCRRRRWRR